LGVTPKMLTMMEVAQLCGDLSGRRCTPRQVRHLLVTGALGTDPKRRPHGQTRLYGIVDVALVRLSLKLHDEGVSAWVARVVITYLRNDLIRTWKAGAATALTITGVHGSLQTALRNPPSGVTAYVAMRDIWRGLDAEIHRICAERSRVWMWRDVAADAVPRATV
jgi:hypothetical protein